MGERPFIKNNRVDLPNWDKGALVAIIDEQDKRIKELEIELENLAQDMYENTVPKNEANERIAHEQELMRRLAREEIESRTAGMRTALQDLVESVERAQNVNLDLTRAKEVLNESK